jgi:RNA polymerase sigma-70 factor (ECF subfamily)
MILDVAEGQIQAVSSILNPDKLRHLGPVSDLRALHRDRSGSPASPGRGGLAD